MQSHKAKYSNTSKQIGKSGFGDVKARNIPFSSTISIFFSGVLTIIGLSFFLLGSLFLVVFGMMIDFNDWRFSDSDPITTQTKVIEVRSTNASENKVRVYEYIYSYKTPEGKEFTGTSYNTGTARFENDVVRVQYLKDNPQISRIEGMRKGEFSPFIIIFLLIFPVIGAILGFIGFSKNIKYIKLVKYGKLAYGTFSHLEATGGSVNKQTIFRMFFKFTDENGQNFEATGETHLTSRLEDEDQELLVYNPVFPEENIMIDALPLSVKKFFINSPELPQKQ